MLVFDACQSESPDDIHVVNATITVTSGPSPYETVTVNATDAANSMIHCDAETCENVAVLLVMEFAEHYCLQSYDIFGDYVFINVIVSISHTGRYTEGHIRCGLIIHPSQWRIQRGAQQAPAP